MKDKTAALIFGLLGLILLAYASGCSDPYTMYQAAGARTETGGSILVMPFMDTRTFLAKNDPHKDDVGLHVRDIFTDVLREGTRDRGTEILTPDMPPQEKSLSTAELAEIGRRHGADAVVAGQVFSFNNTRAASIPPRAGMFVRVISSKTGALLFAGDHYSASSVPLVGGNRDEQAQIVAEKLVEGLLRESESALSAALAIASDAALANISPGETEEDKPLVVVGRPLTPMHPAEVDELPELGADVVDASLARIDARAALAEQFASLPGDELAEDLLSANGDVFDGRDPAPAAAEGFGAAASAPVSGPLVAAAPVSEVESATEVVETEVLAAAARAPAVTAAPEAANGPVVSEPMAFEQPRTQRIFDLPEDPSAVRQDDEALVAAPAKSGAAGAVRVLILPYHDRENENNLIAHTGGGEVVTTLYGTQLALDPGITLMWDGTGMAAHDRLPGRDEAVEMGRLAGADYVMRGQVVEFRRAQSVPSFYSAVISTAVLAAQMFFAEMSGVDVATEVYRVSDGMCVMSRRDRSQQKYVVQAEKTVRRLATGMAESVGRVVREASPEEMDPLIDDLQPVTVLSNP